MSKDLDPALEALPEAPEDDPAEDTTEEVDMVIIHDDNPNASYPGIVSVEDN